MGTWIRGFFLKINIFLEKLDEGVSLTKHLKHSRINTLIVILHYMIMVNVRIIA